MSLINVCAFNRQFLFGQLGFFLNFFLSKELELLCFLQMQEALLLITFCLLK